MKVYVIMGNDYPDAVFSDKVVASAYCEKRKKEPANNTYDTPRIYWRSYEFALDEKK